MTMPTQDQLKEMFEYHHDGYLIYKIGRGKMQKGDKAGNVNQNGYKNIKIYSHLYKEHRLIYFMHYGYLPKYIDHIDCDKLNNKIENLREVNYSQNNLNSSLRKDNKLGIKNVSWCSTHERYRVSMNVNQKIRSLGYFRDLELAELVAIESRDLYHGEYARSH